VVETRQSSNQTLFDEVVVQHGAALRRLCAGYERSAALRDELLQEILLALWRSLPSFRGDASLRTWTYRIAHNVATTHVHRALRAPKSAEGHGEGDAIEAGGPDVELEEARRLERLRRAIASLEPLNRQIILLYLEELPQNEIADITGLSRDNVSTRVGRIKQTLARKLERTP
jgi:RNA polymerase sigma-70 factor, ECF subfamily